MGPWTFLPAGLMSAASIILSWTSALCASPPERVSEIRLPRDRSCTSPRFYEAQDRVRINLAWDQGRLSLSVGDRDVDSVMELFMRILESHHERWIPIPLHSDSDVPWREVVRVVDLVAREGFQVELFSALRR